MAVNKWNSRLLTTRNWFLFGILPGFRHPWIDSLWNTVRALAWRYAFSILSRRRRATACLIVRRIVQHICMVVYDCRMPRALRDRSGGSCTIASNISSRMLFVVILTWISVNISIISMICCIILAIDRRVSLVETSLHSLHLVQFCQQFHLSRENSRWHHYYRVY